MGKPLGNAHQNAECRKSYQFTNQRVFEGQRENRIRRANPHGGLHLVEKMLVGQEYQQQGKKQRGAIRAYLSKVAGLSLAQITRLIRAHAQTGKVEAKVYRRQFRLCTNWRRSGRSQEAKHYAVFGELSRCI
jgi:hypothetical protein